MFSISVVTSDIPLVSKARDLVTKGLSENEFLPAKGWARLRSEERLRDEGSWTATSPGLGWREETGMAKAGEMQNLEGGNAKSLARSHLFQAKRQPLPVEWDLLSGGNCSIMARTPSLAASLSHATDNLSHGPSRHGTILHIQPKGSWSVTTHYLVRPTQVGFLPHESIEGNVVLRLPTACEQSPWVVPVLDVTFLWATSAGGLPHSQLLTVGVGFFKDYLEMFENMFPK